MDRALTRPHLTRLASMVVLTCGVTLACTASEPPTGSTGSAGGPGPGSTGAGGSGVDTTGGGGSGTVTGTGGSTGAGGAAPTGAGGAGGKVTTGAGGAGGGVTPTGAGGSSVPPPPPLDCGPIGTVLNNAGPPKNRVNYVILADGYTSTTVNTTLMTHMTNAMTERFTAELGQPYLRYKNFVNICLFKTVSQTDGIGNGATIFSCTGNDTSRLANCNTQVAQTQLTMNTPAGMNVTWHSIVLNGTSWWNTGSVWMLWSGGNTNGPKAALHEGGHGFHQLADEYCARGTGSGCGTTNGGTAVGQEFQEVNSTGNPTTTDKWPMWLGTTQKGMAVPDMGATGVQGIFVGSRYVDTGQYRPTINSKMNSLFGNAKDTSYNSVSREKMVMDIWRVVVPVDSTVPAAGAVSNPSTLTVNVIDPAVINVDWSVDGTVVAANGGTTFNVAGRGLSAGSHTIAAKAYDNATTDLVLQRTGANWGRMNWARSQQTVTWTVTVP